MGLDLTIIVTLEFTLSNSGDSLSTGILQAQLTHVDE